MSSDEDDYMSESFLAKCVPIKNDIRPGLITNKSVKRQHNILIKCSEEIEKKKKMKTNNSEAERRQQGLQKPINSSNKGFSLLQKMGYKPGQGLGKTESGISEPISINIKANRFGLGRETVLKEIADWKTKKKGQKLARTEEICDIDTFRKRVAEKAQEKQTQCDLFQSQRVCQGLDRDNGITSPDELWFWPIESKDDDDPDISEPEIIFEPDEQLRLLTSYLRKCYHYCTWCGTKFEDGDDLSNNCPGSSRDDH
ncbi:G patch domain-containing protein 11 isoform X2 [Arctopsyche grandis]|uniref:G patch domain-containing protein 11 isoform X2 n=1 Tax=Arctopsyche grandis TaxID=121162 RepID=UPI00406D7A40